MDQYLILNYSQAARSAIKLSGLNVFTIDNFLDRVAAGSIKPSHFDLFSKGFLVAKLNAFSWSPNKFNSLDENEFLKIFGSYLEHPGMKIMLEYRDSYYSFRAAIHKKYGTNLSDN